MARVRARSLVAVLACALAVAGVMMPALGNQGGADVKSYTLCGNTPNCHGEVGTNNSSATLEMSASALTVYTGQPDIVVWVNVSHAEQYSGDFIGVLLFSTLYDPSVWGTLERNLWTITSDPNGASSRFNYGRLPALGATGETHAEFRWALQAPSVQGTYRVVARMQTGQDHLNLNGSMQPVSRDDPVGLLFKVVAPPRVDATVPEDGSVRVFTNLPVVLVFNKEMDRASVEAAFSIDPPTGGAFEWQGTVMRFRPDANLLNLTVYTVSLASTARDLDGIKLLSPVSFSFKTGLGTDTFPPHIVDIVASRAPIDAVVRVDFDEAMDRPTTEEAFSIEPSVPGTMTWEGRTLVFTPAAPLDYDTVYTVRIAPTARDLADNELGTQWVVTFRTIADTVPPRVVSASPKNGTKDLPLDTSVALTFSDDVDASTLAGALSTVPPVSWNITWTGVRATLAPRHALEQGTQYTITIGTRLADVRGNSLAAPCVLLLRTSGSSDRTPPTLLRAYPAPGGRIAPDGTVQLTWSEEMNTTSVEAALHVSPAANASVKWDGATLSVTFQGLEEGRVYTINVGPTAVDAAGNPTGAPYALRYVATLAIPTRAPFFYVQDWIETWWDLALIMVAIALAVAVAVVQLRVGWRRVALTVFAWVEERVRTARYLSQARMLYYSINRQMPQSHAERYGSKVLWYWYPFYCLGGIALLSFVVCSVTGLVLALYYVPSTEGDPSAAYVSIEHIMRDVSFGYMFRALHHWSANVMIAAVFLHMMRVYFTGAYRNPRELNWVAGVVLLGITLLYGFSGYLLPWNQLSYWAGTIGLEMARAVPLLGDWFAKLVFGGIELGAATLTRMYFMHVLLLPAVAIGVMAVHLVAVYVQGIAEPH